ncbi:MAG: EamA family transporter, partial [Candidatus Acidiferrales bacterium]
MTRSHGLHLKTFVFLLLMVVFGPLGDVLLGKGMRQLGGLNSWAFPDLLHFFARAFSSSTVWLGIGLLMAFFICYTLLLSWADFSFVQPASSFAYVIVALLGHYFLGEVVSVTRWIGIAIICLGVLLVGHTPLSTT